MLQYTCYTIGITKTLRELAMTIDTKKILDNVWMTQMVLSDPDLSMAAKGVWFYLMSLRDHSDLRSKVIAEKFSDSPDDILSGMNELENNNYLMKVDSRDQLFEIADFDDNGFI